MLWDWWKAGNITKKGKNGGTGGNGEFGDNGVTVENNGNCGR